MLEFKPQKPWRNALFINIFGRKSFSLNRSHLTILLEFQLLQGELLTWPARPFTVVWKSCTPRFLIFINKETRLDCNAPLELCFESVFLWKHRGAQSLTKLVKNKLKKEDVSFPHFLFAFLSGTLNTSSTVVPPQICRAAPLSLWTFLNHMVWRQSAANT